MPGEAEAMMRAPVGHFQGEEAAGQERHSAEAEIETAAVPLVDEDEKPVGAFDQLLTRLEAAGRLGRRTTELRAGWDEAKTEDEQLEAVVAVLEEWVRQDEVNPRSAQSRVLDAKARAAAAGMAGVENSTFNLDNFLLLAGSHQPRLVNFLKTGFEEGFDILFKPTESHADVHFGNPAKMEEAAREALVSGVKDDVRKGYVAVIGRGSEVPRDASSNLPVIISPVYCIPKKLFGRLSGKWRRVHNLSKASWASESVNGGIDGEDCTMEYTTVNEAVEMLCAMRRETTDLAEGEDGIHMGQIDLTDAYRILPVRPDQWQLLCFELDGEVFMETRVCFGLRSAPRIFSALGGMMDWLLRNVLQVPRTKNYLDDWLLARRGMRRANASMRIALLMFRLLGVGVNEKKLVWATQVAVFLGIEVDTVMFTLGLSKERLERLAELLDDWLVDDKRFTRKELESLTGSLTFAMRVVAPGRMFLRRMLDTLKMMKKRNLWRIRVSNELAMDLRWWKHFLPWFGTADGGDSQLYRRRPMQPATLQNDESVDVSIRLWSDASNVGGGAHFGDEWFAFRWNDSDDLSEVGSKIIYVKEMFALVAAALTWGRTWAGRKVKFFCDNANAVVAVKSGSTTNTDAMHLLRVLHFHAALCDYEPWIEYLPSKSNAGADTLSRDDLSAFFVLMPAARSTPTTPIWPPWRDRMQWEMEVTSRWLSDLQQRSA
jgi:hypothetical protein